MSESQKLYASIIRLVVQLTVLALVNWLLTELPMTKAISLPGWPFHISAVIKLIIGIIMIAALLVFRRDFLPVLRLSYPSLTDLAAMVSDAISLAIITIAYTSFDDAIKPLMRSYSWAYAPIFLAIALWPLVTFFTTLYRAAGPISAWTSELLAQKNRRIIDLSSKCASCGYANIAGAVFCTECGARLTQALLQSNRICSSCRASNRSENKYCLKCGISLGADEQNQTRVAI